MRDIAHTYLTAQPEAGDGKRDEERARQESPDRPKMVRRHLVIYTCMCGQLAGFFWNIYSRCMTI